MVDDVEDGMMDMIEDELDVDFMELDDDTYDQLTSALRGYAEETVDDVFMIENADKSIEERVRERFNFGKSRIYVDSPEDVPDQYEAQTSNRGAVYYETDGGSGGLGGGMSEVDEAVNHFEDFIDDIDVTDPQDEFEREAAQLWSDYTRGEMSEDEFDNAVVDFIEDYAEETLGDEKSIEERVRERFDVGKSRIYVDSEEDVPNQYTPQTSDRGAVYYETDGGSEDFEPADVEMAIRDVEPADVEMALRDEFDIDPDDFDSAGELAPRVGLVLEDFIDAQFGDAAHEQFTMGEDGDVLDDVAMDLAEEYTIQ